MSHHKNPLVYIDSGIGGLPYMMHCYQTLRGHRYIYVADRKHFPYGEMRAPELYRVLTDLVHTIVRIHTPQLIVVACNTASVTTLEKLRRTFSVPFVGVVPAVKPAALHSTRGKIALLVTERTAAEEYLFDLIAQFGSENTIRVIAAGGVVAAIEAHCEALESPPPRAVVAEIAPVVAELQRLRIDTLVLGCTHFIYILDYLRSALGETITIIDSRAGVTKRVQTLLAPAEQHRAITTHYPLPPEIFTTGAKAPPHNIVALATACGVRFGGQL